MRERVSNLYPSILISFQRPETCEAVTNPNNSLDLVMVHQFVAVYFAETPIEPVCNHGSLR
jgi:hypothetical protein